MKHLRGRQVWLGLLLGTFAIGAAQAASATRTSAFEYDAVTGLLTKEIIEPDIPQLRVETTYTLDAYGNKIAATVSSPATGIAAIPSRSGSTTFDGRGQFPAASTNALGQNETTVFDPKFGVVTSLTGPNGLTTQWQYDSFGRKTLEIRADGTRTQWEYLFCDGVAGGTASGCPSQAKYLVQTNPRDASGALNGPWSKTYFDALDREVRSETLGFDGNLVMKDIEYDSLGRVYRVSLPYHSNQARQWTTSAYDALGRLVAVTHPDNTQTSSSYNGLSTSVTNPLNQTQTTAKNSQGQTAQVTDAAGNILQYQYDPFGNLVRTTDPVGNITTLTYDIRGRKTQMADPNMGTWTYEYNAIGELVRQTDAKNQVATMQYDLLGRMTSRAEPDLVSTWTFDSCTKGIGKPCSAATDNGYSRSHSYDSLGRPVSTTTTIDTAYTASATFDSNGRIATQTYPTGYAVKYVYNSLGYLQEVRNNTTNALLWRADTLDAQGHLLQQTFGNGVVTQQTYETSTGRLTGILAGAGNSVQNLSYSYDSIGNLLARTDATQNLSETFLYDSLNRVSSATVNSGGAGLVTQTFTYNAIGNITSRSDIGTYTYGAVNNRPHAVTEVQLVGGGRRTYSYDANGSLVNEVQYDAANNVITNKGRTEVYTSFNMPQAMGTPAITLAFAYGPEHQRVKQIAPAATTIYLHPDNQGGLSYEKDMKPDGSIEHKHFITAGGQVIALVKQTTAGTSTKYFHRDNLGSTTAITDEAGAVVERLAYEAFGKRRFVSGAIDPNNTIAGIHTDRGYTNHEHLDELGLIHMNGRIYDPVLGRFMSADPYIQAPDHLQSYNRYSYVMNSPLNATDPSGYFSWRNYFKAGFVTSITLTPRTIFNAVRSVPGQKYPDKALLRYPALRAIGQIAAAYFGGPQGAAAFSSYMAGLQGGSSMDMARAGGASYVSAMMFDVAGSIGSEGSFNQYAAHAFAGCASGAMSSSGCGRGAASALAGKFTTNLTKDWRVLGSFVATTVVGGTVSELGGGKFRNGAQTAAFGYLFNCIMHECFAQGRDAEKTFVDYLKANADPSLRLGFNKYYDSQDNFFIGRPDIFSETLKMVWDVKPDSIYGWGSGEVQIITYTTISGYSPGQAAPLFGAKGSITLQGSMNEYEFRPGEPGNIGLVIYRALNKSPAEKSLVQAFKDAAARTLAGPFPPRNSGNNLHGF